MLESPAAEMMEEDGQGGQGAERAPLASEEGMEESPIQLSGTEVEITRGKEFKVVGKQLQPVFLILLNFQNSHMKYLDKMSHWGICACNSHLLCLYFGSHNFMLENSFPHSGWSSIQVCEVPGGGGLWGGGGGPGFTDKGKSGNQENIAF